jgi:hypothetical protein
LGGSYTKRADLVTGVQNSSTDVWEQFSGSLDAAALGAYDGEYIQFRIVRNNNVQHQVNLDDVFFDAVGAGSFAEWALDEGISQTTPGYDLDGDGLVNLAEFAMGGDPADAASTGHPVAFEKVGSNFHYVHPRRKDAALTYVVETRTNLVSGVWTNSGYIVLPDTGIYDAEYDAVTNEVPVDGNQTFIRLRVEED